MRRRPKGIDQFPLMDRLKTIFPIRKIKLLNSWSIITATNARLFIGFQLLCYSLVRGFDTKIFCYDLGMTPEQLEWCKTVPGLTVEKFDDAPWNKKDYWQAWIKPFYIKECPLQRCLWIDADAVVIGDLNDIIKAAGRQSLFVPDFTMAFKFTLNSDNLYKLLPIHGITKDEPPYLNTGVFLLDKDRDKAIIDKWCYCVKRAMESKEIGYNIACWDQGACRWALQSLGLLEKVIVHAKQFNYPDGCRQYSYPPTLSALEYFLKQIEAGQKDGAVVHHWMGSPKPWERFGNMFNVTFDEDIFHTFDAPTDNCDTKPDIQKETLF